MLAMLCNFVYVLFPPEDLFENFLCNLFIFDLAISFFSFNFTSSLSLFYYLKKCYFFSYFIWKYLIFPILLHGNFFFPKFRLRPLQFSYLYTAYYKIYHGWNGRNRPVYTATRLIRVINNAQQLIKVISWDNSLFYQSSASIDKSTKLFIWLFNHDIILLLKDAFLKSYFHRQAVLKFILLGMHIQKFDIKIRNSLWSKK